jgi:hypothetical protein
VDLLGERYLGVLTQINATNVELSLSRNDTASYRDTKQQIAYQCSKIITAIKIHLFTGSWSDNSDLMRGGNVDSFA